MTGVFRAANDLFFNQQHPNKDNLVHNRATIGVVSNPDFTKELALPADD